VPQETPACKSRMESLQRLADQKGFSLDNLSLFIEHCATGSFFASAPLAESSGNVPNRNESADMSISQSETSKPSATLKGPLFGRTQEEADQDKVFLNSMLAAQLPHITNPTAQAQESQSLAALRSDFSGRLDTLEGGHRNKRLELERHEEFITEANVKIFCMGKRIKSLEGSRDECVSRINHVQESMRANIQTLETVQRKSSTKADGILTTVDRLETRTANVQKLILRHSDDIKGFRTEGVATSASIQSLNRRCEESEKSERAMKRRIIVLENSEADLRKENQAFRKKTEDRFETLLGIIQNFETLSKQQKADVDALRKEIKDLEMVGEQQRSQISNLKTVLSLQIGTG
jgi:chromosome segregation ATPase